MGVYGLWKLIEPSGKPVPLETLENKVLAVDVSIWLHQAIKGFQDSKGAAVPNAHLLGIYHRVCKLLYFKIKPVFVFDGGVPVLKRQTIAKRQQLKSKNLQQANSVQQKLISTLLKHSAVAKVLSERTRAELIQSTSPIKSNPKDVNNMYALPPSQLDSTVSDDELDFAEEETDSSSPSKSWDLHTIDVKSKKFKALPADVRHEILTELKETRKQNSWGRLHELPTQSDDFSGFQMNRLLNRYSVQVSLDEVKKEMGGHSLSLQELESLLKDTGVITSNDIGKRIASDENHKILYIKDVQRALQDAREFDERQANLQEDEANVDNPSSSLESCSAKSDLELEQDLQKAISLSLQDQPSSSKESLQEEVLYFSSSDEADETYSFDASKEQQSSSLLSSAKNYMTEYSGLTPNEINNIINMGAKKSSGNTKNKKILLPNILEEKRIIEGDLKLQQAIEESLAYTSETNSIPGTSKECEVEVLQTMTDKITPIVQRAIPPNTDSTISEKNTLDLKLTSDAITEMSDDDSSGSDFVEVEAHKPENSSALEIVLDTNKKLEDEEDLFSDIFAGEEIPKIVDSTCRTSLPKSINITNNTEANKKLFSTRNDLQKTVEIVDVEVIHEKVDTDLISMLSSVQTEENKALTTNQLEELKDKIVEEKSNLYSERVTKERLAENIGDQIYKDAQELLQLFGVPYLVAPMEAEAQCAFLEIIGLTDGSITDDSDIWLFGGKTVYKNFFNQSKHVLEFRSDNIEHHYRLSREQLILLAMLVGSDYTTGIPGVGPVTALEILAAFPISKNTQDLKSTQQILAGLTNFRKWFINGKIAAPQKAGLRTKLKNCNISDGFPSFQILSAYLQPQVETSDEKFTWSKPDVVALTDFAKLKFGWTKLKAEEILTPVMKRLEDKGVQKTVRDYFKTKHKLIDRTESEGKMSKRVKNAIDKIDGNRSDSLSDDELQILKETKAISKRKAKAIETDIQAQISKVSTQTTQPNNVGTSKSQTKTGPTKPRTTTKIRFEPSEESKKPKVFKPNLHKKDTVYQKEIAKGDILRNKMKAIETFRKSKAGPGFVRKRTVTKKVAKDDAELSESSNSN